MSRMRIVVDRDLCESNAVCTKVSPAVFVINAVTDKMELVHEVPDESLRTQVEHAVRMCPRGALTLENAD